MTILCDWQIQNAAHDGLIAPFSTDQLNPASYDVLLGGMLLIESAEGLELVPYPLHRHTEAEPYLLRPGQFEIGRAHV